MKPKLITAVLLFISAYSPLFLILAIKDFDFENCFFRHLHAVCVILGVSVLSVILLFVILNSVGRGNMTVTAKEVKNSSSDLISYTIPYIVSFVAFDMGKIEDVISLSVFLLLLIIMTIKSETIFMNPILLLAGYNLYDLKYEYDQKEFSKMVISKCKIKPRERYRIGSLTQSLFIITK